jgi:hypothetical protein
MAAKKSKIRFETDPKQKVQTPPPLCKTKCGRNGMVVDGWCSACFAKHKKGYFTSSGELHPDILRKQRELEEKRKKRAIRRAARELKSIKDALCQKLTLPVLKVLNVANQEMDKPKYCEKLDFWTSDTVCYSRLFITQHKKCAKCTVHNSSLENLLNLTEEIYAKSPASAATETDATPTNSGEPPITAQASNQ